MVLYPSLKSADNQELCWHDDLKNGIWPRQALIWIFAVWMAVLIIRPWEKLIPALAPLHVERAYAIFAIVSVILSGQLAIRGSFQTMGLLLWAGALTISAVFAIDPSIAWDSLYSYFTIFALYFILLCVVHTPYQLTFLIACFIVITTAYLAKSQWEFFIYGAEDFQMGVRRLTGIDVMYGHPNSVAISTVLSLPFLSFLWTVRTKFTSTWPVQWRRLFPWGLLISFWFALSSVVLTNGRAGMVGLVLFLVLTVTRNANAGQLAARLLLALLFMATVWLAMPEQNRGRFRTIWDPESGPKSAKVSADGRIIGTQLGIEVFRRFPVTGIGVNNFPSYRIANLDGSGLEAHNTIGGVLSETGTIGGAAMLIFVSGVFVNCYKTKLLAARDTLSTLWVLSELAIACRNSMILIVFLGMFGNVEKRAHVYWVAAFCLLARKLAEELEGRDCVYVVDKFSPADYE